MSLSIFVGMAVLLVISTIISMVWGQIKHGSFLFGAKSFGKWLWQSIVWAFRTVIMQFFMQLIWTVIRQIGDSILGNNKKN
ncbi:hypothetical protein Hs20B_07450 [Lactococcus insecticola]|uniref:Uncharacterized protein n=2 Tax=Pseudolactococcus insecticola TaxID=2709158 RepID=A0A6A0B935_9LACT|nr:hypothetical protein Hs20B_07450 [Lactococcus insecticola]